MENNAIIRKLDMMHKQWAEFKTMPDKRIFRWHLKQDELKLTEAFCQYITDVNSEKPDIFIEFKTPFHNIESYSKELYEELEDIAEACRIGFAKRGIDIHFQPSYTIDPKNPAIGFLKNFFQFAKALSLNPDKDVLAAYLKPNKITNTSEWSKWWTNITLLTLPRHIRLLVSDIQGYEILDKVAQQNKDKIHTANPEINLNNLILELMDEVGDQNHDGTHFRKAMFKVGEAVGEQNSTKIQHRAQAALEIAKRLETPYLEIAVLCLAGNGLFISGKQKAGIAALDEALKIAVNSRNKPFYKNLPELGTTDFGENIYDQLTIQIHLLKGTCFISIRPPDYEKSYECYQQLELFIKSILQKKGDINLEDDWTTDDLIFLHYIESMRMMGFCSEKLGKNQQAYNIYFDAIKIVKKLSPNLRAMTTVRFIGQSILNICQKQGKKQEFKMLSDSLDSLLGKDWNALRQH
jgi:tetratricopeptide (TPR) repeat protein